MHFSSTPFTTTPTALNTALAASSHEYRQRYNNPDAQTAHLRQVTSLHRWLTAATFAGVPAVPAIFGNPLAGPLIEAAFGFNNTPQPDLLKPAFLWLQENLEPGKMWRWDACSSTPHRRHLPFYCQNDLSLPLPPDTRDPHVWEIYHQVAPLETRLVVRPWQKCHLEQKLPVQFRVFFPTGDPTQPPAVANRHPQRPLAPHWKTAAHEAGLLGQQILAAFGPANLGCVLDFIVTTDQQLQFLDGNTFAHADPGAFDPLSQVDSGAIAL